MSFQNVFIPYGGYWCTPFVKWQGSFANLHPLTFAAAVTQRALAERKIQPSAFEVETLHATSLLCLTADRTSNGPHMTYPNPNGPGGKPEAEDWVWDNFN